MDDDRLQRIETQLAEALKSIDELSEEVARQTRALTKLQSKTALLIEREAAREAQGSGGVIIGDERPPHY